MNVAGTLGKTTDKMHIHRETNKEEQVLKAKKKKVQTRRER